MATEQDDAGGAGTAGSRRAVTPEQLQQAVDGAPEQDTVGPLAARKVDLTKFNAKERTFRDCDFSGSDLHGAELAKAVFKGCLFQQSKLNDANLVGAQFLDGCVLSGAEMRTAEAQEARFIGADMSKVVAIGANFHNAHFTGSGLLDADLSLADLRQAEGLRPNETRMRGARLSRGTESPWPVLGRIFSGEESLGSALLRIYIGKENPWSALRRTYTGPRLLLNLLPVGIFVTTLGLKAAALYYLGLLQHVDAISMGVELYCEREQVSCTPYSLFELVAGVHEGPAAVVFVALSAFYNGLRFLLTLYVSDLREHEEQTDASPRYEGQHSYKLAFIAHTYAFRPLWAVMLALFAYNLFALLAEPITLIR